MAGRNGIREFIQNWSDGCNNMFTPRQLLQTLTWSDDKKRTWYALVSSKKQIAGVLIVGPCPCCSDHLEIQAHNFGVKLHDSVLLLGVSSKRDVSTLG